MIKNLKINNEKFKKIFERGTALTLATIGLVTVLKGCTPKKKEVIENQNGYTNINSFLNLKVKDSDFVILDVGDHNTNGVFRQGAKIRKCNKNDISIGIIVTTDAIYENEIYDDVELVKQIASKYTIDMPVYLNIDKIIENTSINVEQKTKLILDFLEKCSSNDFYCGIHGKDSNLIRVKKYCNITKYDALVVMEGDKIQYDGKYNLYEDKNGKITATKNMAETITKKGLNNANKFVPDGKYIVGDNNVDDIAMEYGMSVDELLKFNNINKSKIKSDTVLRIPCIIDKTIPVKKRGVKVETPLRGCDLSHYQKNISWEELSSNMDFIILKASDGNKTDDTFDEKATICNELSIPIGTYCYNEVRYSVNDKRAYRNDDGTLDEESFEKAVRQEIKVFLSQLKNKKIDYPCYMDIEANIGNEGTNDIGKLYDKKSINILLKIWKEEMEKAGYIPGLYASRNNLDKIIKWYDTIKLINDFELWIAGGSLYNKEMKYDDIIYETPFKLENGEYLCEGELFDDIDTWQISQKTINTGVKGTVDFNFSQKDYTISSDANEIESEIKNIEKRRALEQLLNAAKNIGLVISISAGGIFISKKSIKEIKKRLNKR